ncbi:MAG: 50S ribosomal protein L17 [Candidatus Omnitrophica bacterium]|nr:50S ribosomal protein L17 [Candidatus Omnitrophota bacterium]
MRHLKKSQRLSRSHSQKKALVKCLLRAVVINERITTTTTKAKYLRTDVDRLITLAKENTLSSRRIAYQRLCDHVLVKKLFDEIGPRFVNIEGGYSRVLALGNRKGDGASMSLFELTKLPVKAVPVKGKVKKGIKKVTKVKELKSPDIKDKKNKDNLISGVKKIFKKEKDKSK